jgi:hypothetical protein
MTVGAPVTHTWGVLPTRGEGEAGIGTTAVTGVFGGKKAPFIGEMAATAENYFWEMPCREYLCGQI